ncbi:MAG: ATP phosphoribosyltransferase [Bacteroidetes bacterium]|jgi:ATP phosphoribosyltransferase|nr:ATP phosphoribosyltransferase [Bacteroidota bacterium]
MLATNGRLKLALQRSGRLTDESVQLLRSCGLAFEHSRQSLSSPCSNFDLDILAIRDDDIPEFVQDGVAHLGIVGQNILSEKQARTRALLPLGFGYCRLMVSVPERSRIRSVRDLAGLRIGTTYPATLRAFLKKQKVAAKIVKLSGSVELSPALNVADAICDIVSTGSTARMNGLRPLLTVMESQAVLVAHPQSLSDKRSGQLIERLLIRVRAVLEARGKRYLMMNAPADALPKLQKVIPSLKSPTVVPLAVSGMVAVHSVVAEDVFWDVMERLKAAGATDIVVVPIETIVR